MKGKDEKGPSVFSVCLQGLSLMAQLETETEANWL